MSDDEKESPTSTAELKTRVAIDKVKSALTGTASAAKAGVASVRDAMAPETERFQQNILNILGEQTALTPTGLSPQETAIVEFDSYYVPPQLKEEEIGILKNTMRALFSNSPKEITDVNSGKDLDQKENETYPPCGDYEKALVLASLLYRAKKLRQQLYEQGVLNQQQLAQKLAELNQPGTSKTIQGRDTALSRTYLEHLSKIQTFVDDYDSQQKCIDIGELAYKDLGLELTDEQIEKLLKQFVFFVLQTHYPLKEYRTKDPSAPAFVKRLEKRRIDFDPYMNAYTQSRNKIPVAIAKVLDSIKGDNTLLQKNVLEKVEEERKKILDDIASKFPDGDPFLKTLLSSKDPAMVVDRLRTQIKEYANGYKALEAEKASLEARVKACEQAKALLEAEKRRLNSQVNKVSSDLKGKEGCEDQVKQLQESKALAEAELNARIAEVEAQRNSMKTACDTKDVEIARLTKLEGELRTRAETAERELAPLKTVEEEAQKNIAALQERHQAELAAKDALLTAQIQRTDAAYAKSKQAETDLAGVRTELAAAESGIKIATEEVQRVQGELKKAQDLSVATAETIQNQENQLSELAAEKADIERQKDLFKKSVNEVGRQLIAEKEKSSAEAQDLEQQLNTLKKELEVLTTQLNDCDAKKVRLTAENESLKQGQLDKEKIQLATLEGDFAAAERKVAAAQAEKERLEAEVSSLKGELEGEKGRADSLTKEGKAKNEKLATLDAEVKRLGDTVEGKENELGELKEVVKGKTKTIQDLEGSLSSITTAQAEQYKKDLATLQQKFGEQLAEESAKSKELQGQLQTTFAKASEEYDSLLKVVNQISSSLENPGSIQVDVGNPGAGALTAIVEKLKGKTGAVTMGHTDSLLNQCYLNFLVSFLWKTHFNISNTTLYRYPQQGDQSSALLEIVNAAFNGGIDTRGSQTRAAEGRAVPRLSGIYADYGCGGIAKGAEDCYCKEQNVCALIRPQQETKTIKRYLDIIGRLLQYIPTAELKKEMSSFETHKEGAIEEEFIKVPIEIIEKYKPPTKTQAPSRVPSDLELLVSLERKLQEFSVSYFIPAYPTVINAPALVSAYSKLPHYARLLLSSIQPTLDSSMDPMLRRGAKIGYIEEVIGGKRVKVPDGKVYVFQKQQGENEPTILNYAVLFYTYLVLLRDYLNHVGETGKDVCPLPAILQKASP